MDEALRDLADHIEDALSNAVLGHDLAYGELSIEIVPEHIGQVIKFLRDDASCAFSVLVDICGVDYPERTERFDVVYHLLSPTQNQRLRIKLKCDETSPVPSIVEWFPAANWFEREAYDLYGILFSNHPDLRRLLTDYGFEGHPLRKDFPLSGHVELRYDISQARVVYEPVKLAQEFRDFDFESPWEGADYVLPGDEKATGEKRDEGE